MTPYTLVPRMQIVYSVLEGALDVGDDFIANTCRRLIRADCLGWKKHHNKSDWQLVKEFAEIVDGEMPFPE